MRATRADKVVPLSPYVTDPAGRAPDGTIADAAPGCARASLDPGSRREAYAKGLRGGERARGGRSRGAAPSRDATAPRGHAFGIAFRMALPSLMTTLKSTRFAWKRVMSSGICFETLFATAS